MKSVNRVIEPSSYRASKQAPPRCRRSPVRPPGRRSARFLTAFVLAALVWTAAHAATRLTDNFADLVKMAEAVVEIEVLEMRNDPKGFAGAPSTVCSLSVRKVYKGGLKAGETVTAEYLGGSDGTNTVIASGQPRLAAGQRAVLLLVKPAGAAAWRILSGDTGQVDLGTTENGEPQASRKNGQFDYFVSNSQSLTGYDRVTSGSMPASGFDDLLQAIIKTGKPVLEKAAAAPGSPLAGASAANPAANRKPLAAALAVTALLGLAVLWRWLAARKRSVS